MPLVPANSMETSGSASLPIRPTDRGVIDLITGARLLQEVDFELPFGGAMFRHVRTHSDSWNDFHSCHPGEQDGTGFDYSDTDGFWDWNGRTWMMGENPIFLMDASPYWNYDQPPKCYFVSDAHHAVPFVFDKSAPAGFEYVAPQWFDAILQSVGGLRAPNCCLETCPANQTCSPGTGCFGQEVCPADKTWAVRPTHFELWLNRGSTKYTIVMDYSDVPSSTHAPDASPACSQINEEYDGVGAPFFGLVTKIEDRYGNRVEIDYRGAENRPVIYDFGGNFLCSMSYRGCNQKGQIRTVRLIRRTEADGDEVVWTLVYTHRAFGSSCNHSNDPWPTGTDPACDVSNDAFDNFRTLHLPHMVHTIHAYEGLVDLPPDYTFDTLTLKHEGFCHADLVVGQYPELFDPDQPLSYHDRVVHPAIAAISQPWVIEARYLYDEFDFGPHESCPVISNYSPGVVPLDGGGNPAPVGGRLLKTTVTRRNQANGTEDVRRTIYHYPSYTLEPPDPTLTVLEDSTIKAVMDAERRHLQSTQNPNPVNPNLLLAKKYADFVHFVSPITQEVVEMRLWDLVDQAFAEYLFPSNDLQRFFFMDRMLVWSQLDPLRTQLVSAKTFQDRRDGAGSEGEFAYYLLMQYPEGGAGTSGCADGDEFSEYIPFLPAPGQGFPELWHQGFGGPHEQHYPYRYKTRAGTNHSAEGGNEPGCGLLGGNENWKAHYYKPLANDVSTGGRGVYFMIVDELEAGAGNYVAFPQGAGDPHFVEPPEGVRRRRLVEMNSAGFMVKDRTWSYEHGSGGTITESRGYGEEEIKDCIGRRIELRSAGWSAGVAAEVLVDPPPDPCCPNEPSNCPNPCGMAGEPSCLPVCDPPGRDAGLIHVFEYPEDLCNWDGVRCNCSNMSIPANPGQVVRTGIKTGTAGTVYYLTEVKREIPCRPELVTEQIRFPVPVTATLPLPADAEVTKIRYHFEPATTCAEGSPDPTVRVVGKDVIGPAVPGTDGGTPRHAVDRVRYNASGNLIWHGYGSLADGEGCTISAGDEFFVNHYVYDDLGRPVEQHLDVPNEYPDRPPGFVRASELPTALQLLTTFEYDPTFGLVDTGFPNGRHRKTVYIRDFSDNDDNDCPYGSILQWVYNDLVPAGGASSTFSVHSPVQMICTNGSRLIWAREIALTGTDESASGNEPFSGFISEIKPKYDAAGKVVGVDRQGQGAAGIETSAHYNPWGQLDRQLDPSGTVSRQVFDHRGRLSKVFRGTQDEHPTWDTASDPPEASQCDPAAYGYDQYTDNLVLVEKRSYGDEVNNADRLTEVRRYRGQTVNRYAVEVPPCCFIHPDECESPLPNGICPGSRRSPGQEPLDPADQVVPNNDDSAGWGEHHEYDARRRNVWVSQKNEQGLPIRQSLTWFDHLDRVRFAGEYGAAVPSASSAPHPAALAAGAALPSAAAILGASPGPISLMEYRYNLRSDVEETRRYDVGDVSGNTYTVSLAYFDHAGRKTETISPNAAPMRYLYDAKGRQVKSRVVLTEATEPPSDEATELSGTDTAYDDADRAVVSTRYERRHDASASSMALNGSNSVVSYTYSWYDKSGRLTGTGNLGTLNATYTTTGTESPPDYFDAEGNAPGPRAVDPATGAITGCAAPAGYPAAGLYTCYHYDEAGRQDEVWHADGTVSKYEYDGLGRMVLSIENHRLETGAMPPGNERQVTARLYDDKGRLTKMAAVLPEHNGGNAVTTIDQVTWSASDGSLQVTELVYGADVVNSSGEQESENRNFIEEVRFPSGATGQPDANDKFTFQYYPDGLIAERTDQREIELKYSYDSLGRRISAQVDDSAWFVPPGGFQPDNRPPNRIGNVNYVYEPTGELKFVTAYPPTEAVTEPALLAQSKYEYDSFRNLVKEWQQHGNSVDESSPLVEYDWDASSGTGGFNHNRLRGILYPAKAGTSSRSAVTFNYGDNMGGVDSVLNRITAMTLMVGAINLGAVAGYDYTGSSRRVLAEFGNGACQSVVDPDGPAACSASSNGYRGLDGFGRMKDLHFQLGAATLHRYEYGYDDAGNRTHARVRQATWEGQAHINDRSWLYDYDGLQRLVGADFGQLSTDGQSIESVPGARWTDWGLDNLGNWSRDIDPAVGLQSVVTEVDTDGDGDTDTSSILHHNVNGANELTGVGDGSPFAVSVINDPAGNVTRDSQYIYQYDGLNRLVQVNEWGTATVNDDGRITGGALGTLVFRFTYDGLGRIVRKEQRESSSNTQVRIEDYYYDGVRRIQDVIMRPNAVPPPPPCSDEPVTKGGEEEEWKGEDGESKGDELPPCKKGNPQQTVTTTTYQTWTDREYVYGPGDVNEFVCQLDANGNPLYPLQDGNLNVVGTTDGAGNLLRQDVYGPYGELIATDLFTQQPADNKIGFQGMFFDRLSTSAQDNQLSPGGLGLYRTANRSYNPSLGRWLQRDPNATAQPIVEAVAFNGKSFLMRSRPLLNINRLYSDGQNIYQFVGSNPITERDPRGLSVWDEDVDSMIADVTANRMYVLGTLNEAAKAASLGLNVALDIAQGFLPGSGLYDAVKAVKTIGQGGGGFWEAMDIALAVLPAVKGVANLLGHASLLKAQSYRFRGLAEACNCFVAGTMVSTPGGKTPIECLEVGDVVITRDQSTPSEAPTLGRVTRIFRALAPAIVWLTMSSGEVIGATLDHEVWTFEDGWTPVRAVQVGDAFSSLDGERVSILEIRVDPTPTPIYNLEVDGTFTYFAEEIWVHNNSCDLDWHHIATNKNSKSSARGGPWTPRFEDIFEKAAMDLEDAANKVQLAGHRGTGRHPEAYHRLVMQRLEGATKGLSGDEYAEALKQELGFLADELKTPGTSAFNTLFGGP